MLVAPLLAVQPVRPTWKTHPGIYWNVVSSPWQSFTPKPWKLEIFFFPFKVSACKINWFWELHTGCLQPSLRSGTSGSILDLLLPALLKQSIHWFTHSNMDSGFPGRHKSMKILTLAIYPKSLMKNKSCSLGEKSCFLTLGPMFRIVFHHD